MSCTTCREPNDPHWPAYHSCLAALERRLADRIAKLEAAIQPAHPAMAFRQATGTPAAVPIQARATEPHAALRDYLAQDKSLDELMPSPWQVEKHDEACATRVGTSRNCDCKPAGPIPPGYKLAPGWVAGRRKYDSDCPVYCDAPSGEVADFVEESTDGLPIAGACTAHAVEMGAIVKVEPPAEQPAPWSKIIGAMPDLPDPDEPPAPAKGAPAEPLSARMQAARDSAVFERANAEMRRLLNCFIGEVMTLEAQLSSERERCAGIAEWWLLGNGKQGELVDAIRDGRPAPK